VKLPKNHQNNVYIKGAMAEPCAKTNNPPSNNMEMMIGKSQNFLRTRRNRHNSAMKLIENPQN
jgi:hypothetical protein